MDDIPQKVTPRSSLHLLFINNLQDVRVTADVRNGEMIKSYFIARGLLKVFNKELTK